MTNLSNHEYDNFSKEELKQTLKEEVKTMLAFNSLKYDRRIGDDRRRVYKLGYFINGGVEKRKMPDRRRCNNDS